MSVPGTHRVIEKDASTGVDCFKQKRKRPGHVEQVRVSAIEAEVWLTEHRQFQGNTWGEAHDQEASNEDNHADSLLVPAGCNICFRTQQRH